MFDRIQRSRRERRERRAAFERQLYERMRLAGLALQPTTRRIWLEPGYPKLQPVNADVDEQLHSWVWWPDTLPITEATRTALERWAYDRFDNLYNGWNHDPNVNADAEQAFESDGIAIVRRMQSDLGSEWEVGLFSVKLDRPVWNLDEMPEDEWLYRFEHVTAWDDDEETT